MTCPPQIISRDQLWAGVMIHQVPPSLGQSVLPQSPVLASATQLPTQLSVNAPNKWWNPGIHGKNPQRSSGSFGLAQSKQWTKS